MKRRFDRDIIIQKNANNNTDRASKRRRTKSRFILGIRKKIGVITMMHSEERYVRTIDTLQNILKRDSGK